jgi:hypothetical protein
MHSAERLACLSVRLAANLGLVPGRPAIVVVLALAVVLVAHCLLVIIGRTPEGHGQSYVARCPTDVEAASRKHLVN